MFDAFNPTPDTAKRLHQLVADSIYALVVLANEDGSDWRLIEPPQEISETEALAYAERGLSFAGVLAITADRKPRSEFSVPLDDVTVTAIAREFMRRFARSITHPRWCCAPACGVN